MRQFSIVCQNCNHVWLQSTQIITGCPNCKGKRVRTYPARIGAYRLGCRACGVYWYDQKTEAPCINCGKTSTSCKTIWIKHTETFNFPLRTPVSPDLKLASGSQVGVDVTRLGCRSCNLYWLDQAKEAPCPQCNNKSTSTKPERLTEEQIQRIGFRRPHPLPQLNQLLQGAISTCPNCGNIVNLEQESFCSNCGAAMEATSVVQSKTPEVPRTFCLECGAEVSPGSNFCPSCGASITTE